MRWLLVTASDESREETVPWLPWMVRSGEDGPFVECGCELNDGDVEKESTNDDVAMSDVPIPDDVGPPEESPSLLRLVA